MRPDVAKSKRRWYHGIQTIVTSLWLIQVGLVKKGLHALIPPTIVFLLLAIVLYFIHLSTPIAPFVYSLF